MIIDYLSEPAIPLQVTQLITCVLPDDGTDRTLLQALRNEKGITRSTSVPCRGLSALRMAWTTEDHLPEPTLVKMVQVIVPVEEADAVFDYIFEKANIDRPGGGIIFMGNPIQSTPFKLPKNVPEEKGLS